MTRVRMTPMTTLTETAFALMWIRALTMQTMMLTATVSVAMSTVVLTTH